MYTQQENVPLTFKEIHALRRFLQPDYHYSGPALRADPTALLYLSCGLATMAMGAVDLYGGYMDTYISFFVIIYPGIASILSGLMFYGRNDVLSAFSALCLGFFFWVSNGAQWLESHFAAEGKGIGSQGRSAYNTLWTWFFILQAILHFGRFGQKRWAQRLRDIRISIFLILLALAAWLVIARWLHILVSAYRISVGVMTFLAGLSAMSVGFETLYTSARRELEAQKKAVH